MKSQFTRKEKLIIYGVTLSVFTVATSVYIGVTIGLGLKNTGALPTTVETNTSSTTATTPITATTPVTMTTSTSTSTTTTTTVKEFKPLNFTGKKLFSKTLFICSQY